MLIGGDDISNNVITPWYVYIPARFRFALIGGKLTAQTTGRVTGELDVELKFQICSRKPLLPFPPAPRAPRRACSQASYESAPTSS